MRMKIYDVSDGCADEYLFEISARDTAEVYFSRKDTSRRYEINSILFHSVLSQVRNLPMKRVPHKVFRKQAARIYRGDGRYFLRIVNIP